MLAPKALVAAMLAEREADWEIAASNERVMVSPAEIVAACEIAASNVTKDGPTVGVSPKIALGTGRSLGC
jgi:hypothetical protein